MELLAGFACVLVLLILVAIGAWVVLAALFRSSSSPKAPDSRRIRHDECPVCDTSLFPNDRDCPNCGLDLDSRLAQRLKRVRTAEQEILALVEHDELDRESADVVLAKLAQRSQDLRQVPPPRPAAPLPVARPVAQPIESVPIATPPDLSAPPLDEIPVEEPPRPVEPEPEPEPRRGVLVAFMEERNILWGELVGGLLIVGCSIALVLTLWRSLEELPYFPFLLSTAITAALFGAGQYTLHHWKLSSTSRGLLVISMLLAPLNLLLLANPGTDVASGWLDIGVKIAAVMVFVGIVRAAGRDLIGTDLLPGPIDRRWLLALAVVGAPASQAIPAAEFAWLPTWLPLVCQAIACGAVLAGLAWYRRQDASGPLSRQQGLAALTFIGLSVYALLAAWGLVLTRSADLPAALLGLAVPLALAGVPVIEVGLLVHRRTQDSPGVRAAGTGVTVAGTVLLVAAVTLAWPNPAALALVAALVGLVFTREAWRESAPWFHAGALPALALAVVLGVHGWLGAWVGPADTSAAQWLTQLLGNATSGLTLVAFALVLAAVAEGVIRLGHRSQAVGYAVGGLVAGIVGLFLVSVRGGDDPWPTVAVHAACAGGLLLANVRWRQRVFAEAGLWLVLVGTLWTLWAAVPEDRAVWGLAIAFEALALASLARALVGERGRLQQYRDAAADVAVAAGLVAIVFVAIAPTFPDNYRFTIALFAVSTAAFLLTRVFANPVPTCAGSVAALAGLMHLTVSTAEVKPTLAAALLALLGHATLTVAASFAFRRRTRKRLYGEPLRLSGRIASVLAVPLLLYPLAGYVPEWVGFTLWLAAIWFVFAWKWRDWGAFSAGQAALVFAVVLGAFVWIEKQEWWATTELDFLDPRVFQAVGLGLGTLALLWVAARRVALGSERMRRLWLRDPFAFDRIVIGVTIAGMLVLLIAAVHPYVLAETTPVGERVPIAAAPELAHAFGPATWIVLGLYVAVLVVGIRFTTDEEPDHDAPVLGLALVALCVPLALAGLFAPELAAASALRWGLATVFLVGTAVLVLRESIARTLRFEGFALRVTETARWIGYALFAGAGLVVLVMTLEVAEMGMNSLTPSGPAPASVFAKMGWTASAIVPLALLIVGLSATAVRERSAGYAYAGGLVFTGTVAGGYALAVVTAGGSLGTAEWLRIWILVAGSAAGWSLVWQLATQRVPGGPLLALQTVSGPAVVAFLALIPLGRLFLNPSEPLSEPFGELGQLGWAALMLAGWASFEYATRRWPVAREHVVGFVAVVAGIFAACTVQRWDEPGRSLSFYTMAAVWALAGLGLTVAARGPWVVVLAVGVAAAALAGPTPDVGRWPVPLVLAAYALIAAWVARMESTRRHWVIGSHAVIGVTAATLAIVVALSRGEPAERLTGPLAFVLLAVGLGLLEQRIWSVATVVGGFVLFAWATPDPDSPALWLQRNAWAFVALVASVLLGLEALPRLLRESEWTIAVRQVARGLFPVALAALVMILLQQIPVFDPVTRRTPLALAAVLVAALAVASLVVLAFRFALRPESDPYQLPDTRRSTYVYLAELLLVLFFVHIRFNLPELFNPELARFWTFFVMLFAFIGVGLAELFERRGVRVLAIPMRRTGVLLPLIPLLAFWAKPPGAMVEFADASAPGLRPFLGYLEKLPQHFDNYALLWTLAGGVYGLVALSKRSFGWALLAALAANAGLWSLLAHTGVSAAVHPQVWVIPLALIVLVSEHVNRRELRPDLSAGLRYLGIGMLYIASAADLFIAGVGQTWWLPLILAVFCVAGMGAGIMLRVRAFLFLGAGFLALDVFAMIWHAAVDRSQTWVWYVSGIILGAAILALFAVFEKRRNDVLAVVDRVRQWN